MRGNSLLGLAILAGTMIQLAGCIHISSDPIHVIADVNVNVRVDRQLDQFFAFEDKYPRPATQPATTQAAANSEYGRSL
jgi:hypothetical protein